MIFAVDFDGTCVTHEFPRIGRDVGAVPVLRAIVKAGHKIILWTMRSGEPLQQAVQWFADNEIELWGVNKNPDQHTWSLSPKAYAQVYIDDAALGTPLIHPDSGRPYVDWAAVAEKHARAQASVMSDLLTFSEALALLKQGAKVARLGWNGKGMFLFLVPGSQFKVNRPPLLGIYTEGTEINYRPHIDMRTADGQIVPWVASQSDLLCDDWVVVE